MTKVTAARTIVIDDTERDFFETFGYLHLPAAASAMADVLFSEIDADLAAAYPSTTEPPPDDEDGRLGYFLPAMTDRTPTSLALLEQLAPVAAELLGVEAVAPVYADATVFFGPSPWHTDIGMPIRFVKFGAYADSLDASNGALRFVPGSHTEPLNSGVRRRVRRYGADVEAAIAGVPHVVVPTQRGDVVAIDGKVWHATTGGTRRLQWSLPFIDITDEPLARRFYASFFVDASQRGHDGQRFPFYGESVLSGPHGAALVALGAAQLGRQHGER